MPVFIIFYSPFFVQLVSEKKLSKLLKTELEVNSIYSSKIQELFRGVRGQLNNLIEGK